MLYSQCLDVRSEERQLESPSKLDASGDGGGKTEGEDGGGGARGDSGVRIGLLAVGKVKRRRRRGRIRARRSKTRRRAKALRRHGSSRAVLAFWLWRFSSFSVAFCSNEEEKMRSDEEIGRAHV